MKSTTFFAFSLVLLSIPTLFSSNHKASIREFSTSYSAGLIKGQLDEFSEFFSPDVKIMPEYDKAFLGQENAKSYYTSIFERFEILDYRRETLELTSFGERALEIGTFDITVRERETSAEVSVPGIYFDVWETASGTSKLLTLAWNFDERIEGLKSGMGSHSGRCVHFVFQPTLPVNDALSAEIAAGQSLGVTLMMRKQPEALSLQYAKDAWYSPHDSPIQTGNQEIKSFLIEYAKNWPAFDYIDVNTHAVYSFGEYVLQHTSYNLRWRTSEQSGISTGKGIRLSKRNAKGRLEAYRSIAMHDWSL